MQIHDRLAVIAQRQYGLVTRAQCAAAGYSPDACDRRLRTGQWERVHAGVYRLPGTAVTWTQRVKAATLAVPHSMAYGLTAGRLLGLPVETENVELGVEGHQRPPEGVTLHRVGPVPWTDRDRWLEIPTTSVTRTLFDLSRAVSRDEAAAALDAALARRLVTLPYIVARFGAVGSRGRSGGGVMGELLAARAGQTRFADSEPQRVLWALIQSRRLTGWVQEHRIVLGDGRVVYVDAACPEVSFGIELDSFRWHSQMSDWASDHERTSAVIAHGWSLMPVTAHRLSTDPEGVGDLIEQGLRERGYGRGRVRARPSRV